MKKLIVLILLMVTPCCATTVEDYIKNHEGLSLTTYYVENIPHIGYGHNCYANPEPSRVTKARAEQLFREDVNIATTNAKRLFKTYHTQPDHIKKVLVDMTYNMGYTKFRRWLKFRKAIDKKRYCEAASILKKSRWRRQVGKRAVNNIRIMESFCNDKI